MNPLRTKADAPPAPGAVPPGVSLRELGEDDAGQRLDNLLVRLCKGVPKSHLYQLIRSGQVRVNGRRASPEQRLAAGDRVRIPPIRTAVSVGARTAPAARPVEYPIVLEDEALIAIDKPAGVAVHGGSGVASGVIERLRAARPEARFLELVHRLDRDTSGLLLVAKKRSALVELQRQLRERETDKHYLAIVAGRWPLRTKTLAYPLQRYLTAEGERRVAVQAGGREAITRVTGLAHATLGAHALTLVRCKIETGRTHQIRVHLAHAGFPLAGDDKYGDFELNRLLSKSGHKGMFLHAFKLSFRHPISHQECRLRAAVPAAFEALVPGAAQRVDEAP